MIQSVLPSWRDGGAKEAILAFLDAVTSPGASYVEPADRIATFDNDGTLWVEQPMPPHITVGFATDEDLERIEAQPFAAFAVEPQSLAVYQLGNNGKARRLLQSWPIDS